MLIFNRLIFLFFELLDFLFKFFYMLGHMDVFQVDPCAYFIEDIRKDLYDDYGLEI